MPVSKATIRTEKGNHETYFGVMIFFTSDALRVLFHKGLSSPAGAAAATQILACDIR
jgi:hypothetical protein